MARKRKADMTHAQRVAADIDKFRKQIHAEHLEEAIASEPNDDIEKFRADSYKQALRDAKASR